MKNKFIILFLSSILLINTLFINVVFAQSVTPTENFSDIIFTNIMLIVYAVIAFFILCIVAYVYVLIRRKR